MLGTSIRGHLDRSCFLEVVFLDVSPRSHVLKQLLIIYDSNLPIGGASFLLVLLFLRIKAKGSQRKTSIQHRLRSLDLPRITLIIAAVCCLLLALHWGGTSFSWSSSRVIGLFVGFALLTIAFGFVQWKRGERATIPLRLLRQRSVFMGAWYLFFLEMSIYIASIPY